MIKPNNLDNKFCKVIYDYEKNYEKMYVKSLDYKIKLTKNNVSNILSNVQVVKGGKKKDVQFILVGLLKDDIFTWSSNANELMYKHLKKYSWVKNKFVSKKFLDYFFQNRFTILKKYPELLTYILSIANPAFNLIKFTTDSESGEEISIYGFVKLGINDNYDYEKDFVQKFN